MEIAKLFEEIEDDVTIYHCKAHGQHVAVAAEALGSALALSVEKIKILKAAGLWHDVGMLLKECPHCDTHEAAGANHLRHLCHGDLFCLTVADTVEHAPKIITKEDVGSGKKKRSLTTVLSAADYIAQCAHPCYLLMLGKLFETFEKHNVARGHNENKFKSRTDLLYDEFVEKVIYPGVRPYLKLSGMEEYKRGFELNVKIRTLCREKGISYEELDKQLRQMAGIEGSELSWSLPITYEYLSTLLQKNDTL